MQAAGAATAESKNLLDLSNRGSGLNRNLADAEYRICTNHLRHGNDVHGVGNDP